MLLLGSQMQIIIMLVIMADFIFSKSRHKYRPNVLLPINHHNIDEFVCLWPEWNQTDGGVEENKNWGN